MKKLLSIMAILSVVSFSVNAQSLTSKRGENYLPQSGDWSIGFNMDGMFSYLGNAFNGNTDNAAPSVGFLQDATFVGKKFTSDNTATRYSANLGFYSDKEGDVKTNGFNLTAGYGKEWRKGKTRLQGFYGADALVSFGSATDASDVKSSSLGVGVNGFLGAEYFILPKVAIGAQYNYGLGYNSTDDGTTKSSSFGLGNVGVNGGSLTVNLYF